MNTFTHMFADNLVTIDLIFNKREPAQRSQTTVFLKESHQRVCYNGAHKREILYAR